MFFYVLGTGYLGKALLIEGLGPEYSFLASTTSPEKIPDLTPLAKKVFLLKSSDVSSLEGIIEASDAMGVFIAPHKGKTYEETYLDTAKIISTILEKRTRPFYLIYTSSTFVYKCAQDLLVTENTTLNPTDPKAKILLETENTYLHIKNTNITTCILRLGGIYGPDRTLETRAKSLSGKDLSGDGLEPTNHIHLEDITRAISFCTQKNLKGVFNLVNDNHISRKELYSNLCKSLHIEPPNWSEDIIAVSEHGCAKNVSNQKIKNTQFIFKHLH